MNYWRKVSIITKVVEKVGGILEMDHYSLSSGLTKLVRVSFDLRLALVPGARIP